MNMTPERQSNIEKTFHASQIINKNPVVTLTFFTVLLLLMLQPAAALAQMFSIEEPERRMRPASSSFTAGPDFLTMTYREGDELPNVIYEISDPIYRLRLELPGLEVYGGFRNRIGPADSLNYINLGANISGSLPLTRSRRIGIGLPLWLSTDYVRVMMDGIQQPESEQFRQSSASIGIGTGFFYNPMQNVRIRAEFVPQIGFTVSSIGSDSGQLASLNGRAKLHFDNLINRFGLVLSYNYTWRRYSGSDEKVRYDFRGHNVGLGVSF